MNRLSAFDFPVIDQLPPALQEEVVARRHLSVYRMVMHTPAITPSFLAYSDALRHNTSLPGNWREVIILRVGHRYDAPYEVHHHQRLARGVGLSEDAIAATHPKASTAPLATEEKALLELTDELLDAHGLSAASRDRALSFLTRNQLADMVLTVGFYQMVCNFLTTFGVPIEEQAAS